VRGNIHIGGCTGITFFAREEQELERSDALDSENSKVSVKEMICFPFFCLRLTYATNPDNSAGILPGEQKHAVLQYNSEVIAIPATERAGLSWQHGD
jgi:hypothetical protein